MAWRPYWRDMLRRAHADTLRALHLDQPKRGVTVVALYVIAILLLVIFGATSQAVSQMLYGAAAVAALALVYPAVFGYNLLRAPDRVAEEKGAKIASLEVIIDDLRDAHSRQDAFGQLLSLVISAGNQLRAEQHEQELIPRINSWIENTRDLISDAISAAEAEVFMSNNGFVSFGDASLQSQIKIAIERRMRRLNELVQRLDRVRIRDGFNPEKWAGRF